MWWLLTRAAERPSYGLKRRGREVAHFKIGFPTDRKANFQTRCFRVVFTDGSEEDFSYSKCIDNAPLVTPRP